MASIRMARSGRAPSLSLFRGASKAAVPSWLQRLWVELELPSFFATRTGLPPGAAALGTTGGYHMAGAMWHITLKTTIATFGIHRCSQIARTTVAARISAVPSLVGQRNLFAVVNAASHLVHEKEVDPGTCCYKYQQDQRCHDTACCAAFWPNLSDLLGFRIQGNPDFGGHRHGFEMVQVEKF
mmetsp:Transcript_11708/g.19890  ORF Transcript_11708/g.19890 Transcript_11708/m.19890 type:complete len:183 (-) Transcript_11708:8-556(-)